MEKDISNEELERIRKHIDDFSIVDLVIWRNQMIDRGRVNNRLYYLIDNELKKRDKEIIQREQNKLGK